MSSASHVARRMDVVVPIFNEQEVIRLLHHRLCQTLKGLPFVSRIIYVDDGSSDQTITKLIESLTETQSVELIQLSRNFGQSAAIQAGLEAADAEVVVLMDGDLQDPPELIQEMVERWELGYEVVLARRTDRQEENWLRRRLFLAFHWLFQKLSDVPIPRNCGTFCLLDRRAASAIRELPEAHRFFPGMRAWVGFDQGFIDYERPRRAGGTPKQTFRRLFNYALDGILGYSKKPARWMMGGGLITVALSVGWLLGVAVAALAGYASVLNGLNLLTGFLGALMGLQFFCLGIVSEIMFRTYEQTKSRPRFLIANRATLHGASTNPARRRAA